MNIKMYNHKSNKVITNSKQKKPHDKIAKSIASKQKKCHKMTVNKNV